MHKEGWILAPDALVWALLKAVWPGDLRTWVVDRATRYAVSYTTNAEGVVTQSRMPLSDEDEEDLERSLSELVQMAGFAGRPRGRVWLLRPIRGVTPEDVCALAQTTVGPDNFLASRRLTAATQAWWRRSCVEVSRR